MQDVEIPLNAFAAGLPPICALSGEDALEAVEVRAEDRVPPMLIVFAVCCSPLFAVIARLLTRKSTKVPVPLHPAAAKHSDGYLRRRNRAIGVMAGAATILPAAFLAAYLEAQAWFGGLLLASFIAVPIVILSCRDALQPPKRALKPIWELGKSTVILRNVHPRFAHAVASLRTQTVYAAPMPAPYGAPSVPSPYGAAPMAAPLLPATPPAPGDFAQPNASNPI